MKLSKNEILNIHRSVSRDFEIENQLRKSFNRIEKNKKKYDRKTMKKFIKNEEY